MGKSAAAAIIDPIGSAVRAGAKKVVGGDVADVISPLSGAIDPSKPGSLATPQAGSSAAAANLEPQDVATRESDVVTRRAATSIGSNEQYLLDPSGDALNQPKRKGAASRSLGSTF